MAASEDNTPLEILEEFILEKASGEPIRRRLLIYRALACQIKDLNFKKELNALAQELEAAEHHHQQLLLSFRTRHIAS